MLRKTGMSDLPVPYDWMMAGHYIADCEEQPAQWVTVRSEEAILKDRGRMAYILFYIKKVIYTISHSSTRTSVYTTSPVS